MAADWRQLVTLVAVGLLVAGCTHGHRRVCGSDEDCGPGFQCSRPHYTAKVCLPACRFDRDCKEGEQCVPDFYSGQLSCKVPVFIDLSEARGTIRIGPAPEQCQDPGLAARQYFGDAGSELPWSWLGRHMCLLEEPELAGRRARPGGRLVRCAQLGPPVVVRLEERGCRLTVTSLREEYSGGVVTDEERGTVPGCGPLLEAVARGVRAGGGGEHLDPAGPPPGGVTWTAEVVDGAGYLLGAMHEAPPQRDHQAGLTRACQALLDAAAASGVGVHLGLPDGG